MTDDGNQVRIAHFVESVAFGERMWLDRKIVHVRDPLRRGLRVVAADAILRVELRAHRLLVTQRDLVNGQLDALSRCVRACWQSSLYRPPCWPSGTVLVTCPLESVSAAAGVKLTPAGPLKYTAAPATALPEASFTCTTTG